MAKKKETLVYKPYAITLTGKLEDGKDTKIIFTPQQFKEWIFKLFENGFDNVGLFSKDKIKNNNK